MIDGDHIGLCGRPSSSFCHHARFRVQQLIVPDSLRDMTSRLSRMTSNSVITAGGLLIIVGVGLYFIWKKFTKGEERKELPYRNERRISFDVVTADQPVPQFIKHCIEMIEENGREHRNIYRVPGNKKRVDRILENIQDSSLLELEEDVDTVCSCLKAYIAALSKPLIPADQQDEFLKIFTGANQHEALMRIVPDIPVKNRNVLASLMLHLNRIQDMNATASSLNLAICWWPSLLHRNFTAVENLEHESPRLIEMISAMICHANSFF
ncbi:rho GTPase-activating protein 35-like isoform X2 [Anneissia japonica]|uniref:rho GTPase-activating protein 35-like isoform X2 n=1 Tax=Anneissia japonica TaxID=1529436 RepID=UPI001425AB18|nr:rho GTPase-activating protein 35-like isoform X2 [Anneissia japonica]